MRSSPKCLDFSLAASTAIREKRLTTIRRSIGARVHASVVGFLQSALRCPGKPRLRWLPTVVGQIYIDQCGFSLTGKSFAKKTIDT